MLTLSCCNHSVDSLKPDLSTTIFVLLLLGISRSCIYPSTLFEQGAKSQFFTDAAGAALLSGDLPQVLPCPTRRKQVKH